MHEYECYPIWVYLTNGLLDNISPYELPINKALADEILNWDEIYQRTYDKDNPSNSRLMSNEEQQEFIEIGKILKHKLERELNQSNCTIVFYFYDNLQ